MCDSLWENTWQPYFVKKSGITFYDALNINPEKVISQGGTSTHPKGRVGGQQRAINLVSQSLKNEDGSYSQDKFVNSNGYTYAEALYAVQEDICRFYGIPMIDLRKNSNMSLLNAEYFFNKNNVHPKKLGMRGMLILYIN